MYKMNRRALCDTNQECLHATAIAVGVGLPLAPFVDGRFETVLLGLAVCVVQVALTLALTRDRDVLQSLLTALRARSERSGAGTELLGRDDQIVG